jgi:S-adenosylmethionine hydrolase
MAEPLVTLTTDFGHDSAYVAALKGVLLDVNPAARVIDLSHSLPPQGLRATAVFLTEALSWFPPGTTHVVVVDPGVGTQRAILCVEWAGSRIIVPDNGCWTPLIPPGGPDPVVYRLTESKYWRPTVSSTFHGRDVMAPAAGHLSLGVEPAALGPRMDRWVRLELPRARVTAHDVRGEVVEVDRFGNLISNVPVASLPTGGPGYAVRVDDQLVGLKVRTYAEAAPGTLVALTSSNGMLEIAVAQGSAAKRLRAEVGTPVVVSF